jgi:beta-lactam-binding protein with PASTA domain
MNKTPKPQVTFAERMERLKAWWVRFEAQLRAFAKRVLPRPHDDEKTRLFKTIAWSLIGMAFLVVFLSVSVFFLALRGEEETMIPQVVGKDLATALIELQEKELTSYVQVKFSDDPRDKGNIVGQDPQGGILTKAGRRVTLWVSRGAIIDNVENFVGQNINDVQLRLKSLFSTQPSPLLVLTPNPVYTFNSAPEGTVLEQKPLPGTPLAGPTELVVVISKGPKGQTVKVGKYDGRAWPESLAMLIAENKPFIVKVRKAESGEKPGMVVGQAPATGSEMPKGTPVTLTLTQPAPLTDGRLFQVLQTTLPEYPILVDVKIELRKTTGDVVVLFQLKHPGGLLTVPFIAAPGDIAVVSVLDKEVLTQKVGE